MRVEVRYKRRGQKRCPWGAQGGRGQNNLNGAL